MSKESWKLLSAILIFSLLGPPLWDVTAAYDYGGGHGGRAGGNGYGRSYDEHNHHGNYGNGGGGGQYGHGHGQEYGGGYGGGYEHGGFGSGQRGGYGQGYEQGHGQEYHQGYGGYGQHGGGRYDYPGPVGGYGPRGGGPMPPPSQQQAWPPMGPPSQAMPQVPWSPQQFPQPSGPWGPQMPPMGPPSSPYGQPCMPPYCPMAPGGQPPGMPGGQPGTPGGPPGAGTTAAQTEPPSTTNANGGGPVTGNAASTTPTAADGTGTTVGAGTGTTAEISPATGTTTPVTSIASSTTASQAALSLAQRAAALDGHNNFRSSLANGTAQNQTGTMPTGTNIIQLAYDTALETTAESWAQQCTFEHSTDGQRNGAGENLYWTSDRTIDFARVLQDACNFWWNELVQFGIQASLNLTLAEFNKGIGHWSQMAWSSTAKLGCGVNVCSNATYVVCHYSPAGNVINQLVYQSGTPCGDCATAYGNRATCNTTNSLCVVP